MELHELIKEYVTEFNSDLDVRLAKAFNEKVEETEDASAQNIEEVLIQTLETRIRKTKGGQEKCE